MDSVGEGEGGEIWENGIETCKISCMKRVASPGSMHDTGCLGLVHWDDPEGWYGDGGGRRVQDGEHRYTCGGFISCMILYLFQCHSPKSYHPLPLPQSPKDCSIHLSLLLSRIQGYHYHLSKFRIYVLVYCIDVFYSGLLHFV